MSLGFNRKYSKYCSHLFASIPTLRASHASPIFQSYLLLLPISQFSQLSILSSNPPPRSLHGSSTLKIEAVKTLKCLPTRQHSHSSDNSKSQYPSHNDSALWLLLQCRLLKFACITVLSWRVFAEKSTLI
jgi:hypothetical protein